MDGPHMTALLMTQALNTTGTFLDLRTGLHDAMRREPVPLANERKPNGT